MGSLEKITHQDFTLFLGWNTKKQQNFLSDIDITSLKGRDNGLYFKKFLAMKVFMEARIAFTENSTFNLLHQIARLFGYAGSWHHSENTYTFEGRSSFLSISTVDNEYNLTLAQSFNGSKIILDPSRSENLSQIFNYIRKSFSHNTIGFSLYGKLANFTISQIDIDAKDEFNPSPDRTNIPLLIVGVFFCLVALIPCALLSGLEYLLIRPFYKLYDLMATAPSTSFIKKVEEAPTPEGEILNVVNIFKQAVRCENNNIGRLDNNSLAGIAAFGANSGHFNSKTIETITNRLFESRKKIVNKEDLKEPAQAGLLRENKF